MGKKKKVPKIVKKRRNFDGHYYNLYSGGKSKSTLKSEGFFVRNVSGGTYVRKKPSRKKQTKRITKDMKAKTIIKALKMFDGAQCGGPASDIMDKTWGPRADWTITGGGIYSGDSGEFEDWDSEHEYQKSHKDLNTTYQTAKKLLKDYK